MRTVKKLLALLLALMGTQRKDNSGTENQACSKDSTCIWEVLLSCLLQLALPSGSCTGSAFHFYRTLAGTSSSLYIHDLASHKSRFVL
jgi:hypothetical protein